MQLAESARYKAYILIYGKIYAEHLDITDSWKDLAWILTVGSRISHMQSVLAREQLDALI